MDGETPLGGEDGGESLPAEAQVVSPIVLERSCVCVERERERKRERKGVCVCVWTERERE